jgi:hypothetical protein
MIPHLWRHPLAIRIEHDLVRVLPGHVAMNAVVCDRVIRF